MKILTIGFSGVGKTSFLSCMYGHFQKSRCGITLCQLDDYVLFQNFEKIEKNIYPERTVKRSEYRVEFCSEYCEPYCVTFVDYAGNIFDEREMCAKTEMEMFHQDCTDFDGIICFIEQKDFEPGNITFDRIIQILCQIVPEGLGKSMPIEFIITKCDKTRAAVSDLRYKLHSLLQMAKINPNLYFAVFQVSCAENCRELLEPPIFFLFLFAYLQESASLKTIWMKQYPTIRFIAGLCYLYSGFFIGGNNWNNRIHDFRKAYFGMLGSVKPIVDRLAGELLVPGVNEINSGDLNKENS